jgi:hypothetical protein
MKIWRPFIFHSGRPLTRIGKFIKVKSSFSATAQEHSYEHFTIPKPDPKQRR